MNGAPDIDLAGEMGFSVTDHLPVIVLIAIALVFLLRRVWRRRGAPVVCDSCPGCGGEPCRVPDINPAQLKQAGETASCCGTAEPSERPR